MNTDVVVCDECNARAIVKEGKRLPPKWREHKRHNMSWTLLCGRCQKKYEEEK